MLLPRWNQTSRHPDMKQLTQDPTLGLSGLTECLKCKSDKGRTLCPVYLWNSKNRFPTINDSRQLENRD